LQPPLAARLAGVFAFVVNATLFGVGFGVAFEENLKATEESVVLPLNYTRLSVTC
jgi:hypothetical protein